MMKVAMSEIIRIKTNPRRGRAVIHNGVLYVGGQTADDENQDIRGQVTETLAKLDAVLEEAGTDKTKLLTAIIWLKDIERDFKEMNEVWDAWIDQKNMPTRATAQCEMATPDTLFEVIVTAAV